MVVLVVVLGAARVVVVVVASAVVVVVEWVTAFVPHAPRPTTMRAMAHRWTALMIFLLESDRTSVPR
jgi:hypothetical protein